MNEMQIFDYKGMNIRIVEIDGEPWFILKDVCDILGIAKARNVLERLDDDEKGAFLMDTPGGQQKIAIINESGLYNVILRSDKPEAKPLRKHVTSVILPSIRKTDDANKIEFKENNMNEMQIFKNTEFGEIRTILYNDEVWFCAKDIASALGYVDTKKAIATHCKAPGVIIRPLGVQTGVKSDGTPAIQMADTKFINESNVYRLAAHSRLPSAEKFESWVFDEILPTTRKTGGYIADENKLVDVYFRDLAPEYKELFRTSFKTINHLSGEVKRLNTEVDALNTNVKCLTEESTAKDEVIAQQTTEIEQAKPKVHFYNTVADSRENLSMAKFAKLCCKDGANVGQNRLFKWFRDNKYLRKNNEPYQQYVDAGYFYVLEYTMYIKGVPSVGTKTLITGKGQQYFYKKIMADFAPLNKKVEV